jgi:predicted  nucleic acid-binding Zn-ribbon protein
MPEFTAPLPQQSVPEELNAETHPATSRLVGGALSAYNSFFGTPVTMGFNWAQESLTKELDPGRFLTSEEYEKSEFKVPGLNFPNGVSQNVAKLRKNRARINQVKDNAINNMPAGFLSWAAENVGALVGTMGAFAVDPIAGGIAATTTSLTSRAVPWLLSKLEGTFAKAAVRGGIGFGEGAAISLPITIPQYENERELGQDQGALSILANSAIFGAFGSALRLGFGFDRGVIKQRENLRAQEVAIDHLTNGKPAYIEPVIKNGAYQMSKESEMFLKRSEDMIVELPSKIEDIDSQIKEKSKALKSELRNLKGPKEFAEIDEGHEFVQRLDRMREKPSDFMTAEEKGFSKRFISQTMSVREPSILKKIFDISEKSSVKRSVEEQDLLDNFIGDKESDVTADEISKLRENRDALIERMKEAPTESAKTKLKFKVSDLNDRIKINEKRLDDLQKVIKFATENESTFKLRNEIKNLEAQKNVLESTLDANKVYSQNINTNQTPLTETELRNYSDTVQDWRSDFAYSADEHTRFRQDVDSIPENIQFDSEQVFDDLKDLREDGELTSKAEDFLDEVKKDDEAFESVSNSLRDFFDCLLKRGE